MGQPPNLNSATDPAVWVMGRQFTGRIVTVSNRKIFDEPVYNYSRDFGFIFEEIAVGIGYRHKYERAEEILLGIVGAETKPVREMSAEARRHLKRVFDLEPLDVAPRVYYRMTDNWVELSIRFLCETHKSRQLKDQMYRQILRRFKEEGISIASGTYDIVGLPPVQVQLNDGVPPSPSAEPS
jgi:small-conductance mechanosensitive channel